jgi:serine/threonine-protein kinase
LPDTARGQGETRGPKDVTSAGPAQAAPEAASEKIKALGDYQLTKKLGEGGMGTVYKAHQVSLDRDVALKVLFKNLASKVSFVERFQREARVMARLDHPNILRCFGVGEDHGYHYFSMEYVEGGSLQSWLAKHGKFSVADALFVTLACAEALRHAHEQNIIHRDIKPDNILLTKNGVIKVADLGLVKAHGEDVALTRTGTGAGTPLYMSPEQFRDAKRVDQRADIYALGCMLYVLLTNKPPFEGEAYVDLLDAKERGRFTPARKFNDEIPERLDLMIDKMIAKKPEHRYQSCAELIQDLRGLGLAGSEFTLMTRTAQTPAGAAATASAGRATSATARPTKAPSAPSGLQGKAAPGHTRAPETDLWYLSYQARDGKMVRRRMTTDQVRELIRDDGFDLKAQASQGADGAFRALASYPEFENALRGRIAKVRADRKAAKFHKLYENLEAEERRYQRWRWMRKLFLGLGSWVAFLIWMAIIAGLAVGGFFLFRMAFHWIGTRVEQL